jgi:RHS repeat-associated protein
MDILNNTLSAKSEGGFGMAFNTPNEVQGSPPHRYLYNNKELQNELGLGWYDYGFRYYDAQIGRFTGIDPIAEDFYYVTPYNYAENEPIAHIDLWGLQKLHFTRSGVIKKAIHSQTGYDVNRGNNTEYNKQFISNIANGIKKEAINTHDALYKEENKLALFLLGYMMAPFLLEAQLPNLSINISSSDLFALRMAIINAYKAGTLNLTQIAVRNPKLYEFIMQVLAESTPAATSASSSVGVQLGAKVVSTTIQELLDYLETLSNPEPKPNLEPKPKPKPEPKPKPDPEPKPKPDPQPQPEPENNPEPTNRTELRLYGL